MGLMQMLFWRKNFDDGNCPSSELFAVPYLEFPELSSISYVKPIEQYFALEPGPGLGLIPRSTHRESSLR
jgi:hypothetical protein